VTEGANVIRYLINWALCYKDSGGILPSLLISALNAGEMSDSCLCRFSPGKEPPVPI
jgi:hypothetical protein